MLNLVRLNPKKGRTKEKRKKKRPQLLLEQIEKELNSFILFELLVFRVCLRQQRVDGVFKMSAADPRVADDSLGVDHVNGWQEFDRPAFLNRGRRSSLANGLTI